MYLKKLDITKRCLATENKGKIINLNLVTTHFYFQCTQMMMNNISTSDGLTILLLLEVIKEASFLKQFIKLYFFSLLKVATRLLAKDTTWNEESKKPCIILGCRRFQLIQHVFWTIYVGNKTITHLAFTCSKSTMETPE